MKQYGRMISLLLIAALLVCLCSCGKEETPEPVAEVVVTTQETTEAATEETTEETTEVAVQETTVPTEAPTEETAAPTEQTTAPAEPEPAQIDAETGLVAFTGENAKIYAQENAAVRRFANEANTIILDAGSVICDVTDGEPCQVQTSGSTTSADSGLFRVSVTAADGVEYAQTEVFEGEATVTIPETGESVTLKAGEAATTAKPEGGNAFFVQAEAVPAEEGTETDAQNIHPINYQDLPEAILEKLTEFVNLGRKLSISDRELAILTEKEHDDQQTVVREATCTEDGILKLECTICGDVREEPIPALGHTEEEIPAVEPDCTCDGLTAGVRCAVCGETLQEQEVVPALGHTEAVIPGVAARCEKDGLTSGTR